MTAEDSERAAWAEMGFDASAIGLRHAIEKVLIDLRAVSQAGGDVRQRQAALAALVADFQRRAGAIPELAGDPAHRLPGADPLRPARPPAPAGPGGLAVSGLISAVLGGPLGGARGGGATVYRPAIEVKLLKMVQRRDGSAERYSAAEREIDLTPFLGDGGGVRTLKTIYEAAGGFTITFSDQAHPRTMDSVAAMVEPMDMIEIRGAREPHKTAGGKLPLIMRGWVSDVRRTESVSQDGTPQRTVTIQGQDAGKLWLIHQVIYEIAVLQDVPFLDLFRMQAATGIDVAFLPVSEFMRQLTERIINDKVRRMAAFSSRQVAPFRVEATVRQGIASATTAASVQGPIWDIAEIFADRPWNELFIEDQEEGPLVRFRPAPYRSIAGAFIMPDAVDPGTVEVDDSAAVSLDMQRTDKGIANFFWVPPGSSMLDNGAFNNVASLQRGEGLDFSHGNNRPELYGVRRMQVPTKLLPNGLTTLPSRAPTEAGRVQGGEATILWHRQRAQELKAMNRDNGVLEDGSAVLRGSEELKVGRYMRLTRGDMVSEAYMTRVSHQIAPLQGWTTNVTLERSTGFLERTKRQQTAYFGETGRGPNSR